MARTITEIRDEIITAKNAETELAELTSDSKTAIWRLWAYVVATVIYAHEVFFEAFRDELQEVVDLSITGTGDWYVRELFKFQLGDPVTILDGRRIGYAVEDPAKRIIAFASYDEQGGLLVLRVAKDDGNGNPTPLSATEREQVAEYVRRIRFAGTATSVQSNVADTLQVDMTVYYDGLYTPSSLKTQIVSAMKAYLSDIEFGGVLVRNKLIDAIQSVPGVQDIVITRLEATDYRGIVTAIDRIYKAQAGYMELDTVGRNPEDGITLENF